MTEYIKNLIKEIQPDDSFKYMLLDRMRTDCNYYLDGHQHKNVLWAEDEAEHIADMEALYNSFPNDKKPLWITMADIEEYKRKIVA